MAESTHPSQPDDRIRVLAITSELPWPLDTGGHLRSYHLLRSIARECCLTLVTAVVHDNQESVQALQHVGIDVKQVVLSRRSLPSEATRALRAFVSGDPYLFYRRHDRPSVRTSFARTLESTQPHVVYLDHLDSFAFHDLCSARPTVLDLHNCYSLLVERAAIDQRWPMMGRYLRSESRRLQRTEIIASRQADVVMAVSSQEQAYFRSLGGLDVRLVPNGVDCDRYEGLPTGRPAGDMPTVLYVGGLSWPPNAAAAWMLVTEIMPEVRKRVRDARVCIVGAGPAKELLNQRRHDWVEVTGWVPDVTPYLARASALAVPLESGGGTRLKILEAFAAGLPVVSTRIGAEGIDVGSGRELLIAEKADMAGAIVRILSDNTLRSNLAQSARAIARRVFDWSVIGRLACEAVTDVARRGRLTA